MIFVKKGMASVDYRHVFGGDRSIESILTGSDYKELLSSVKTAPHKVTQILQKYNPSVIFVFTRSKNANILVVEYDSSIRMYWLMLEGSYVRARRRRGISNDYEDMNLIERTKYWKYEMKNMSNRRYRLTFNQLSRISFVLNSDGSVKCEMPRGYQSIQHFQGVYIQLGHNFVGIPYVKKLTLFGRGDTNPQSIDP